MHDPKIYSAGKVKYAALFREMRDKHRYNINASWIDYSEEQSKNKRAVWIDCLRDASDCNLLIVYAPIFAEEHRGTIAEAGHAMGNGCPVYCIGKAKMFNRDGISDSAFTFHPLWNFTEATEIVAGYLEALTHYYRNYAPVTRPAAIPLRRAASRE